jgi:hypothetical protein
VTNASMMGFGVCLQRIVGVKQPPSRKSVMLVTDTDSFMTLLLVGTTDFFVFVINNIGG